MPRGWLRGRSGMSGVLFENSIVCLVVFVCCFLPRLVGGLPVFLLMGCGLFYFASFDWLLGQIFLIRILPGLCSRGFCLESLILAQDERWRRA